VRKEMTLQNVTSGAWARELATLLEKRRSRLRMGCELTSHSNCCWCNVEIVEMIDVLSECGPGFGVGWVLGTISATTSSMQREGVVDPRSARAAHVRQQL
jgi:hypothetical protein